MKTIEVTIQEIWQVTRPVIQKSKKTYTRKQKHKNKYIGRVAKVVSRTGHIGRAAIIKDIHLDK